METASIPVCLPIFPILFDVGEGSRWVLVIVFVVIEDAKKMAVTAITKPAAVRERKKCVLDAETCIQVFVKLRGTFVHGTYVLLPYLPDPLYDLDIPKSSRLYANLHGILFQNSSRVTHLVQDLDREEIQNSSIIFVTSTFLGILC